MKRLILGLLSILLIAGALNAQEDYNDAFKEARKLLGKYDYDPAGNQEALMEAKDKIDLAEGNIEKVDEKFRPEVYLVKGRVYTEVAARDVDGKYPNAPLASYNALRKALDKAEKKWQQKDAAEALRKAASLLLNVGDTYYQKQQYKEAYQAFNAVLETQDVMEERNDKPILSTEEELNNLAFAAGLCAINAEMNDQAKPIFSNLYESSSFDQPFIYEAMYKLNVDDNQEMAVKYLNEGREKFPEDTQLLYAEINHYLRNEQLDKLEGKLKTAIKQDPKNTSLYFTLGYVYDNLFQNEYEAGNKESSKKYFNQALDLYGQALEIDDQFGDALYGSGALYYNKAAALTNELRALEDDLSAEGLRKYEAKKNEILKLFDKALPYFQRAEVINPNDLNTLIALKEIYAKKGSTEDLKISMELKKRMEKIQGGGTNDSSYFDK